MIFLAVGTQLPFDRLVSAVDAWAVKHPDVRVKAQVGPTALSLRAIEGEQFVAPEMFGQYCAQASILVAHAGMGSILGALQQGKPLIVMPRRFEFGEHRNDHQLATANKFKGYPGIYVAENESELFALLDRRHDLVPGQAISNCASPELTRFVRSFILA